MTPMTPAQRQNMIRAIARLEDTSKMLQKVALDLQDLHHPALSWACRFLADTPIIDIQTKLKELLEKGAA